uniref:Uncharacterized protein n=1 Tax=Meloidogyne enterolobii TaxID=390850 RepID=A0A6V7UDE7_MELEN|nr:unnamed protein product [Meloidogyne enterolobii]
MELVVQATLGHFLNGYGPLSRRPLSRDHLVAGHLVAGPLSRDHLVAGHLVAKVLFSGRSFFQVPTVTGLFCETPRSSC